jgi:TolB-like protein/DNA-binding winged helix-turn-helix (wHTH) protein
VIQCLHFRKPAMEPAARTRWTRFGAFDVDLCSGEVHKQGIRLKLQDQPFQVLALLLERAGEVVTREELRQRLWPGDTFVDFDCGLNSAIKKLRDVLADSPDKPRYIETLPRRGYRFIAPVSNMPVAFPLKTSFPRTEASQSDISNGTPPSGHFDSKDQFVAPSPTESFPLPPQTSANTQRRQLRVGLALGVTLAILALGAMFLARPYWASRNLPAPIRSVAVLPLENLTGDPSQEYFADGMTDALITELAQVRGLKIISRTSVMHYKGATKTLPEIARELGVDAVVEGTVARSGDEVKITAQLIRASTDAHLWAASYTRPSKDVPRLQADVAREVIHQISDQLIPVENKTRSKPPVNPEAYDAYLKGAYYLNKQSPDGTRTAIGYFQRAVEQDSNFAAAYSGLAACYVSLSVMSEISSGEAYTRGKEAAQKAVSLDDNLDQAHSSLAWIAVLDWDWTKAETEYRRAIQINPNSTNAHTGYFFLLLILGKSKESAQEERAIEALDPLSVHALTTAIFSSYYKRQYDAGLSKARSAIDLYPQVPAFHIFLSNFYSAQGQDKLSGKEILLAEETGAAPHERLAALKAALEEDGPLGLRRKRIQLNKRGTGEQSANAYDIAIDCAAVGDRDQAIVWLKKALEARDSKVQLISVEPIFDDLRSDPRFISLLRQMGLPQTPLSI